MTCRGSKLRYRNLDIIAAVAAVILAFIAAVIELPTPITAPLGIALFVATGYVWSEALLDHRIGGLERAIVAAGLAMVVPVLGGLGLYALGVPLSRSSWAGLMAAAALSGFAVLVVRRRVKTTQPRSQSSRPTSPPVRTWALLGLAALIAGGAVLLAREGAERQHYAAFTQLWISRDGTAHDVIGITNREAKTTAYRLVVHRPGQEISTYNLTLRQGQTWRHAISSGTEQHIVADLYRLPVLNTPYRFVDSSGSSS